MPANPDEPLIAFVKALARRQARLDYGEMRMPRLSFTGQQSTTDMDILLAATLDGKPIGVRVTLEVMTDYGLDAAKDKAVEKVTLEKFELNGGIRVTTSDFA